MGDAVCRSLLRCPAVEEYEISLEFGSKKVESRLLHSLAIIYACVHSLFLVIHPLFKSKSTHSHSLIKRREYWSKTWDETWRFKHCIRASLKLFVMQLSKQKNKQKNKQKTSPKVALWLFLY